MPTPVLYTTLPDLQTATEAKIYQNAENAITGTAHQQNEIDQNQSLWRTAALPLVLDTATGTFGLNPGVTDGNVYQWNGSAWAQVQTKTSKTLWVDATYGVDATAEKYNPLRPYQTLTAAQTAATSGDLIRVRPGAYAPSSTLGKNGVDWYFEAGATVTGTINDGGTAMSFTIYGQGVFTNSTLGSTVAQTSSSSVITIYARSITNTLTGATANAVSCGGGTQTIYANLSSTGSIGQGASAGGSSTQTVYGDVSGQFIGVACAGGATQYIHGNVTSATRAVSLNSGLKQVIIGDVTGVTAYAGAGSGTTRIDGLVTGIITMTDAGSPTFILDLLYKAIIPSAVPISAGATLVLSGGARLVSAAGTNCATGAGTIISYGGYATLSANVSVTVTGTLNVGSYVQ